MRRLNSNLNDATFRGGPLYSGCAVFRAVAAIYASAALANRTVLARGGDRCRIRPRYSTCAEKPVWHVVGKQNLSM